MSDFETVPTGALELKPCPFCGGEAEVERQGTKRQSCIIACIECGCRHEGPDEYEQCGYQWNMRVTDQAHAAKTKAEWQAQAFWQFITEIEKAGWETAPVLVVNALYTRYAELRQQSDKGCVNDK